jgi:16S rRNA (guanine966-N2)-methyltransferase
VREAVFNILAPWISGARFLDLFAGTGAVGIEALSRGAGHVVFVDNNAQRCSIMKDMLEKFGLAARATVVKSVAAAFLKKSLSQPFDIIFIDPPYASDELEKALAILDNSNIISDNGIVIAEHSSKKTLSLPLMNLGVKRFIVTATLR